MFVTTRSKGWSFNKEKGQKKKTVTATISNSSTTIKSKQIGVPTFCKLNLTFFVSDLSVSLSAFQIYLHQVCIANDS